MERKCFFIFSHRITPEQEKDLKENWDVKNFHYLPEKLQSLWSNIPPDLPKLDGYLRPIKDWLKENGKKEDLVLIQGDFGAVYLMINYAFQLGLIPFYATTERVVEEKVNENGEVVMKRKFRHKIFRIYGE